MEPLNDLERRRDAWSAYWATGGLHSCIGALVEDHDGAIGRFWRTCFSTLHDGDRVLDLATGNGALPKLLLESTQCNVAVDAIDLAELRPSWFIEAGNVPITFHPNVRMESLPFQTASFDLVMSQFGLEYAQWPASLNEVARVCRGAGRVAFVLHHADSVIVRMGHAEQVQQQLLLMEDGLVAAALDLLPHLVKVGAGEKPDVAANCAREAYNRAMRLLAERISSGEVSGLLVEARQQIHLIVGGHFGIDLATRRALLQNYAHALEDASVRTRELLACALNDAQVGELVDALSVRLPGHAIDCQYLAQGDDAVAWGISTV